MSAGQVVGYVRVSTFEQNTERQLDGLQLDKVFTDHQSGKDTVRPKLSETLGYVREGDTLVVHSMDRLARSLKDLLGIVDDLTGRDVAVRFVKEGLTFTRDESDPCSVLMLQVLGACYQFERAILLQRQREGIAVAKAKGKYKGRKPALSEAQAAEVLARLAGGESASVLAREFGVARATVYNMRNREVARLDDGRVVLDREYTDDQLANSPYSGVVRDAVVVNPDEYRSGPGGGSGQTVYRVD